MKLTGDTPDKQLQHSIAPDHSHRFVLLLDACILAALLLAACQPQPATATPVAPTSGPSVAATSTPSAIVSLPTGTSVLAVPRQPAIHKSSSDPNAPDLIVVRDQPIQNGSVTIDQVRAAQAGWLVIYLAKKDKPGHQLGFVALPSGSATGLVVALQSDSGVAATETVLAGKELFVVLQAGSKAPGDPVQVAGRSVLEAFTVLASNP